MFSIMPRIGRLEQLEHVERLARIQKRHVLRGGDDDRPRHLGFLAQRHGDVPGAGRQVDEEDVELPPLHLRQHLLQRAHQHRAAPDHGLFLGQHEADGHAGDAMGLQRE
jgi:hypothetical protein